MASRSIRALPGLALASCLVPAAAAQTQRWITQFGTPAGDHLYAAAEDGSGGVFVGGPVSGVGNDMDAWLSRFDGAGHRLWTQRLGTPMLDALFAAASDGAGGVFSAGYTDDALGGPSQGGYDAWFARHDSAGQLVWIGQLGTPFFDFAYALASDGAGGAFVAGNTTGSLAAPHAGEDDVWIARLDGTGTVQWSRQLGSPFIDKPKCAVADGAGGVFVCGETWGNLAGPHAGWMDAWLARFDAAGGLTWSVQLGTSGFDFALAVTADGTGGVFVGGSTNNALGGPSHGNGDAWVARYDGAGAQQWITQFGRALDDEVASLVSDGCDGLIACGKVDGAFAGAGDALIARLDGTGALLSMTALGGANENDRAWVTARDGAGGLFVAGDTWGGLAGPNLGSTDVWLARYDPCQGVAEGAENPLNAASLCPGDQGVPGLTPCPCANFGASGHGCGNSAVAAGALLVAAGSTAPDTVTLTASGMPASTTTVFLKGDAHLASGAVFGDGVRCVSGNLIRLGTLQAAGGSAQFPVPGGPSVSARGQTPYGSGLYACYQTSYRNAALSFCPPAAFNMTQAVSFAW